jgi:hypothetical protein
VGQYVLEEIRFYKFTHQDSEKLQKDSGPLDSNHMYSSRRHRHHSVKSVNVQTGISVANLFGLVISAHFGVLTAEG